MSQGSFFKEPERNPRKRMKLNGSWKKIISSKINQDGQEEFFSEMERLH